jgi:hypothetical protein
MDGHCGEEGGGNFVEKDEINPSGTFGSHVELWKVVSCFFGAESAIDWAEVLLPVSQCRSFQPQSTRSHIVLKLLLLVSLSTSLRHPQFSLDKNYRNQKAKKLKILWKPKIPYPINNRPIFFPVLNQIIPVTNCLVTLGIILILSSQKKHIYYFYCIVL